MAEHNQDCTFVEQLLELYTENVRLSEKPEDVITILRGAPQGHLYVPINLILYECGISLAGDQTEIAAYCAHVMELDLSDNDLQDWHEISKIVSNIPRLTSLGLSFNPLAGASLDPQCVEAFAGLRKLVLYNTRVSWDAVLLLTQELPDLQDLNLGCNGYSCVRASRVPCPSLRQLDISRNSLHDWAEVRKIGSMFPNLETLVMHDNNLASIQDSKDILQQLFPNLRSFNLYNSDLNQWEDLEKLNFFPKLEEVVLHGIPLFQTYTAEEKYHFMIAQLPAISKLNGIEISVGEREIAERFFIRNLVDFSEEELPCRYHCLVTKYGKLEPPRDQAEVHCDEKVEQGGKQLAKVLELSANGMRIDYIDKNSPFGPEEMKYNKRVLHFYGIQDGDEILVVPKNK